MTSTPKQCLKSVKNRLEAIRLAMEENELPLCFDELKRAVADLNYAMRLLDDNRYLRR